VIEPPKPKYKPVLKDNLDRWNEVYKNKKEIDGQFA